MNQWTRLKSMTAVVFLVGGLLSSQTFAQTGPVEIIRAKDKELQQLLRDKNVSKQTARVKVLINGIFDFEELGRRALGPATWAKMSATQKPRFVKAFKAMVENSSVKKLEAYTSDSTRYEAADINGEKATVTAHVYSKGSESIVVYKLWMKNGEWKAWDLVIDDLSTAGNYGDQFRTILKNNTLDNLIGRLESKAKNDAGVSASTQAAPVADNVKSKPAATTKTPAAK